jgi:hypothetical protein
MDLEMREYYNEKYEWISNLLLYFSEDTYYPKRSDEDTIRRFVEEVDGEGIKDTIKEGVEVLELKPFPWEWVSGVCNGLRCGPGEDDIYTREKLAIRWVLWMIEALEEEGRRVGKLPL